VSLVTLGLVLRLLAVVTGSQLVVGPTYVAAEWDCGGEYNCYVVAGHVPGERMTLDYELEAGE
jgi:hypothetical protein